MVVGMLISPFTATKINLLSEMVSIHVSKSLIIFVLSPLKIIVSSTSPISYNFYM